MSREKTKKSFTFSRKGQRAKARRPRAYVLYKEYGGWEGAFEKAASFFKKGVAFSEKACYNNQRYRGIAQLVEQRSPKPRVQSSSLCAPAKKSKSKGLDFFICAAGTTSFAWHTQHHLSVSSTSLPPRAAQMNEVEALPQMKWACAQ